MEASTRVWDSSCHPYPLATRKSPNQFHLLTFSSHFRPVWEACPSLPGESTTWVIKLFLSYWCMYIVSFRIWSSSGEGVHSMPQALLPCLVYLLVGCSSLWYLSLTLHQKLCFSTISVRCREASEVRAPSDKETWFWSFQNSFCYNSPQITTPIAMACSSHKLGARHCF